MRDIDDVIREADLLEAVAELDDEVEALTAARVEHEGLNCGEMSRHELAMSIAGELKAFDVSKLFHSTGFSFDEGLNRLICDKLRKGKTVAVFKIYEPQDLPENHAAGERTRNSIH